MNNVKNLLENVNIEIKTLQSAQKLYGRQLAPNFSVFDYISTNETGLSYILADLLNPQGSHDQKETFLKLFIEHCLPDISNQAVSQINWQPFLDNLSKVSVTIEEGTRASQTYRRMDIYLSCTVNEQHYGICIENKPYAGDQKNQLKDYASEIEIRSRGNWHMVYLKEYNEEYSSGNPSIYSVDEETLNTWIENKKFTALKFSQLIDWLKACQVECQNHSVNEFLSQFIKFIQQKFLGVQDMTEENAVLELMIDSKYSIDSSFKIFHNLKQMKIYFIQKLKNDLSEAIKNSKERPYKLTSTKLKIWNKNEKIIFLIPNNKIEIHLDFEGTDFHRPHLGIYSKEESYNQDNEEFIKTEKLFREKFISKNPESCNHWAGWYEFQPHDWWNSSEPWQMIKDGTMAEKIIDEVDAIYQLLKENNCIK
ncbi:PDDEXK-like family protein [Psychrobacter sp. I-STPA10]|uniref:PDDEXK-like family protein n=1 Tax=Psychrobacter sp. I-STPA10 TaxID=2585769 RepID=UPI001E31F28E|nr:PD-(D/E)XK nuclease family protein [Psychrobacter sp. I-STPA10]